MLQKISGWSPAQKIAVSFAMVIFTGSILLSLPVSQLPDSQAEYLDNLFTAVSLVCVTGLFTQTVYTSYTIFGQIICIIMMQIGGLGLMTLIASVMTRFGRRLGLRNRLAVQEGINRGDAHDFKKYLGGILKYTAVIEGIGIFLLALRFVPKFGWARGMFTSLFLAVSAFNNAGFDNLGATSLIEFVNDPLINLVIAGLIILGGIGFSVWFDVTKTVRRFYSKTNKRTLRILFHQFSLHTRLALLMTFILIAVGTLFFVVVEYDNEASIGNLNFGQKVMAGFFQTVTMRTAGFATVDYTTVYPFTRLWFIFTMFIGGSPGGTAGGLKTTTFAMIFLMVYNEIRGQKNVNVFNHTIVSNLIKQAIVIFVAFLSLFLLGACLLSLLNPEVEFSYILFETISALATVGVSANLTPTLGRLSQLVLMLLMFAGRIGPITLVESIAKRDKKVENVNFSRGNVLIG